MKRINREEEHRRIESQIDNIANNQFQGSSINDFLNTYFYLVELITDSINVNGVCIKINSTYAVESSYVTIVLKAKRNHKVKYSTTFKVKKDLDEIIKILKEQTVNIIKQIFDSELADYYVTVLNKDISRIQSNCECRMLFSISDNVVENICDDFVVFGITEKIALSIPKLPLYDFLNRKSYISRIKEQVKICQTPLQLVKYDNVLLEDLGLKRNSRPDIILRSTFFRNISSLGSNGEAYLIKEGYISIIKSTNGIRSVLLRPIDINSLLFRDEDISNYLKEGK